MKIAARNIPRTVRRRRSLTCAAAAMMWMLLALLALPVQAGPTLPQILKSTSAGDSAKPIDTLPDPSNLRADWWQFFAVEPDQLAARVQRAKDSLARRYSPESDLYTPERAQIIDRIRANLDAFVAVSGRELAPALPAPGVADHYTPAQALELVRALRKARLDQQFDVNEFRALNDSLDAAREKIDRTMAAYLQQRAGSPERLAGGFEIIAERTALASSERQVKQRQRALEARQGQVEELTEAELAAERRLRASPADVLRLEEQIATVEPQLESARQRLFNDRQRVLESSNNTTEDQIAAHYRRQRAVRAAIELERLKLTVQSLKTQRQLAGMLAGAPNLEEVRDAIEQSRGQIESARKSISDWTAASERERDRAGEELSVVSQGPAVQTSLSLMNQDRLRLAQESVTALRALTDEVTQLEFLVRWTTQSLHSNEGPLTRAFGRLSDISYGASSWMSGVMDRSLFKLGATPVTLSGLFRVLLVIALAWLLSWLFRRLLNQLSNRFPKDSQSMVFVIGRLAHYLIIGIGVIAGLSSIGLSFTNFALVAGALALGLGFGLQSIVNNFLSGLILFFERTVKVGDFVELESGHTGEIKSINVRGTIVNTNDNIDIVVPNSQFTERRVINWTLLDPFRRIHVPFRVAYDSDEDKVVEAGLDAAGKLSSTLTGVLGREPSVWLVNYGENGLDFELIVWLLPDAVKRPDAIFAAYQWEIKKALRRFEIEIPVPQREIRFRPGHPPPANLLQ